MADKHPDEIEFPLVFPLSKVVEVFGEKHDKLELREPTAGEFVRFGIFDGDMRGEQLLELIAALCGKTPKEIQAFPGTDMLKLGGKLSRFFALAGRP